MTVLTADLSTSLIILSLQCTEIRHSSACSLPGENMRADKTDVVKRKD